MLDKEKFRLSLRQVLTIPYVALVLALALTIVGLSYVAGSRAVDTVSSHLLLETVGRIGQSVDRHIVGSGAVLEAAFPDGMPVAPTIDADIESLRTRFWIATSLHLDPNNYVYFGNRLGQGVGLYRHSRTEGELRIKLKPEDMRTFYRFTGIGGKLAFHSRESKLFDPRTRPWYEAGATRSAHTWTAVYIDFGTADLVATRARRVLGPRGEFEGVVATDVSLRALNEFVSRLPVSRHGLAFIVEPDGALIASSASANVKLMPDGSKTRLSASESGNLVIAAAYGEVRKRLAEPGSKSGAQTFDFRAPDGQVIHAAYDRLRDDAGLEWVTVVAMPRGDFMAGVTGNVVRMAVLSALAALVAIAIGLRILSWVARDLKHLSEAALRVGDGQLNWPVGIKRPDEIGQLAKSFETMQQLLQTDALTSLANREAFMLRLRQKIGQSSGSPGDERFAVLFIDLNRFKHINDHFGHEAGDRVLIEVAQRLRSAVRSGDLVARLSGDEFVILLDRVDSGEGLERVRQEIQASLKVPFMALGKEVLDGIDFGGSVGEAIYPDDGADAESLLKKADRRMYGQKFAERAQGSSHPLRRASDQRK
uniref:diguanylate cyclase domain-containing protein n=1 Tax=Rhodoferax sp. TaxID=50421 RepID=UPI0027282A39|nr:diguanylate cyclase [Rhodoferax sp.]MDO9195199.1 diguanylate cyclase [Rhodoferax sp.]